MLIHLTEENFLKLNLLCKKYASSKDKYKQRDEIINTIIANTTFRYLGKIKKYEITEKGKNEL